jgi:hypothetical protein
LTSSSVFPVGGESGTQAQVTVHSESCKHQEGQQGSISELLVEENLKMFEGKDRSPELLTDLPG